MSESNIGGVSFRGILALIVIATVCIMAYMGKKVEEPIYSLVLIVSGAYFGQSKISRLDNGNVKNEPGLKG